VEPVTLLIALVAGGAVLLIVYALSSGTSVDPVQARLTQLGTMEAKNLEELELQRPLWRGDTDTYVLASREAARTTERLLQEDLKRIRPDGGADGAETSQEEDAPQPV